MTQDESIYFSEQVYEGKYPLPIISITTDKTQHSKTVKLLMNCTKDYKNW
jgi:hypothetical protein